MTSKPMNYDKMRYNTVERLKYLLESCSIERSNEIAKRIYKAYPKSMTDKGNGVSVRIDAMDNDFLVELIQIQEPKPFYLELGCEDF